MDQPGIIGSIDGSQIKIKELFRYHWEYFNFKHFYSQVVHSIVDADRRFIYIDVRWPGRVGYESKFQNTSIWTDIVNNRLLTERIEAQGESNQTISYWG